MIMLRLPRAQKTEVYRESACVHQFLRFALSSIAVAEFITV